MSKNILSHILFCILIISLWSCSNPSINNISSESKKDEETTNNSSSSANASIYTITFIANIENAINTMGQITGTQNSSVTINENSFVCEGYSFEKWNTTKDGTGESFNDKSTIKLTKNLVLYAQWKPNTYIITFDSNGGTGIAPENQIFLVDETKQLNSNTFIKENHKFICWNTLPNGQGTDFADNAYVKNLSKKNGSIIPLYAQWLDLSVPTYTISTSSENGNIMPSKGVSEAGEEIKISLIPDRLFSIDNLNIKTLSGRNIEYSIDSINTDSYKFVMPEEDVIISASFVQTSFLIDIKEMENGNLISDKSVANAGEEIIISVLPDEFATLQTINIVDNNGLPVELIASGEKYKMIMPSSNVVVNAQFDLISYTVDFVTDCNQTVNSQSVKRGNKLFQVNLDDNSQCKDFLGWYTDVNRITRFDFNTPILQDMTLYAKWGCIEVTNKNIIKVIKTINYSCELHATGNFNSSLLEEIRTTQFKNPLSLDLSSVSGLTSIGKKAFYSCKGLLGIILPDTVVTIEAEAFNECTSLKSIIIPYNTTTIGSSTFWRCSSLENITLPESIIQIGNWAFRDCKSLKRLVFPDSTNIIGQGVCTDCINLLSIGLPHNKNTSYGATVFEGCTSLETLIIPSEMNVIQYNLVEKSCIKNVIISDGVTTIGDRTFSVCETLQSVNIPESVTKIEQYAFASCSSLENIILPSGLQSLGSYAFQYCTSLKSVTIPNNIQSIGLKTFYRCTALENVILPQKLKYISTCAFEQCTSLVTIDIPNGTERLMGNVFAQCTSLKNIFLPSTLTEIGSSAFINCSVLESISIPESVTSIGSSAFKNCVSLRKIKIPEKVTSIGSDAFYDCYSLEEIELTEGLNEIYGNAFYGCNKLSTINVPKSVKKIMKNPFPESCSIVFKDTTSVWFYSDSYECSNGTKIGRMNADNIELLRTTYAKKYFFKN